MFLGMWSASGSRLFRVRGLGVKGNRPAPEAFCLPGCPQRCQSISLDTMFASMVCWFDPCWCSGWLLVHPCVASRLGASTSTTASHKALVHRTGGVSQTLSLRRGRACVCVTATWTTSSTICGTGISTWDRKYVRPRAGPKRPMPRGFELYTTPWKTLTLKHTLSPKLQRTHGSLATICSTWRWETFGCWMACGTWPRAGVQGLKMSVLVKRTFKPRIVLLCVTLVVCCRYDSTLFEWCVLAAPSVLWLQKLLLWVRSLFTSFISPDLHARLGPKP